MDDQLSHLLELGRRRIARVATKHQRDLVEELTPRLRLQIILGARGVGKTTALRQFAKLKLPDELVAYLDLDDLHFAEHRLIDTIDLLYESGYRHVMLDEAHRYAQWAREIKNAYDRYDDLHLLVTGSSMSSLVQGDADLSRRARWYTLHVLSFREYLKLSRGVSLPSASLVDIREYTNDIVEGTLARLREQSLAPLPLFAEYLKQGAYPFVLEDAAAYHDRLRRACHTTIDLDVAPAGSLTHESVHKLKRLLELLASSVPYRPNVSNIERQIAADRKQVYRLLDLLEKAALIRRLWTAGRSPTTLRKPEKIYLDNTNLAYAFGTVDVGNLRETAFLMMTAGQRDVVAGKTADFEIDGEEYEIGGRSKSRRQLPSGGYRVIADVTSPYAEDVLPLWTFGLLGE